MNAQKGFTTTTTSVFNALISRSQVNYPVILFSHENEIIFISVTHVRRLVAPPSRSGLMQCIEQLGSYDTKV